MQTSVAGKQWLCHKYEKTTTENENYWFTFSAEVHSNNEQVKVKLVRDNCSFPNKSVIDVCSWNHMF